MSNHNTIAKPTTTKPTNQADKVLKVLKVVTRIKAGPSCRRC